MIGNDLYFNTKTFRQHKKENKWSLSKLQMILMMIFAIKNIN